MLRVQCAKRHESKTKMNQHSNHPFVQYLNQLKSLGMDRLYLDPELLKKASPEASKQDALTSLHDSIRDCADCGLCEQRTQVVFGVGNANAEIVFVGEGPGQEEDRQGIPFVGRAGQLLTQMIEKGMGIPRDDVYICNVVKCRPPNNRDPLPEEVASCETYLTRQLDIIRPKAIVALGKFAAQTLLKSTTAISRLRGNWHEYHGIPLMPTFHPSYLLRQESKDLKRQAWEDLIQVLKLLGKPVPGKKTSS